MIHKCGNIEHVAPAILLSEQTQMFQMFNKSFQLFNVYHLKLVRSWGTFRSWYQWMVGQEN